MLLRSIRALLRSNLGIRMPHSNDLICFSHLRWGFVFQRPNHLMSRFANRGRVFYVEEPEYADDVSVDAGYIEVRRVAPDLLVCTPHLARALESPGEHARGIREQARLLDWLIEAHRIEPTVLWYYTPMSLQFSRHVVAPLVVYDCMDELSAFLGAPEQLQRLEAELLGRAGVVFTGGKSLYESKRQLHRHVHAFPSSVDRSHWASSRLQCNDPSDQSSITRPRLGFFGVIDERIDLGLLRAAAVSRRDWQFIMIGPVVKIDPSSLPREPNLHWLGMKQYSELPAYVAGWDVALMPFALNRATQYISPTKTLEYMAAGKPIVSTAVRDVVEPYGRIGVVHIADTSSLVQAIESALHESAAERIRQFDEILAATSWDQTWKHMVQLMDREINAKINSLRPATERDEQKCLTI
jgi:UDP-galactopyranose mutase